MPHRRFRQPMPMLPPDAQLARAIRNIDSRLEDARRAGRPVPLDAHRARRILLEALERCRQPDLPPQDFAGCGDSPSKTHLPLRDPNRELHTVKDKSMAYDWTGEATRKRNRLKWVSVLLLGLLAVMAVPLAVTSLL